MIELRDFSFRFAGSDRDALRNITLDIAPGEFVVIVGPSGGGKSTLALAIGGFLFNQYAGEATGDVLVAGIAVRQAPVYEVADVVGLVQQNPEAQFCTLTVEDEVAFGLENRRLPSHEIETRLAWALKVVGASHLRARALMTLSGGEKQKVAIAAMLAAQPAVVIFDEPTSNLDPTATAQIFDVIARIRAETHITVVVIEHKVAYLRRFSPRFVRLEEGQLANGEGAGQPEAVAPPAISPKPYTRRDTCADVKGLTITYDGRPALDDLTLQIGRGEFVAVLGDNGSGKSTLLLSLLGLRKPDKGRVTVFGRDTRATPVSKLAQWAGFVFQNPDHQLFTDSVWQEAILAPQNFRLLNDEKRTEVAALLASAGLRGRENEPPHRLSYGQKRRLNLISVLSYAPPLLLLDEALIGQDPGNARFIMALLKDYVALGNTVVLVNHAPDITQRYADRVLFFEAGKLLVDAPAPEAFARLAALGRAAYLPAAKGPAT